MSVQRMSCRILKKFFSISVIVILVVMLSGCKQKEIVEKIPIDKLYTEAHSEMETEYEYKYDILNGKFMYVPNLHTVKYPDKYEVQYKVTYNDGSEKIVWEEVVKQDFDKITLEDTD